MEQETTELRSLDPNAEWSYVVAKKPRPLTNDEKKAAEAAFQQLPFNPEWSEAARRVYDGIAGAIARLNPHSLLLHEEAEAACEKAA